MNQELMRLLFNGQGLTLGEATARAKAATDDIGCPQELDFVRGSHNKIEIEKIGIME